MGLNKYMYALSFLIQRGIWCTITSLIMAVMIYFMNMSSIGFGTCLELFAILWLLSISYLGLALAAQNLFSDKQLVAMLAPFILFLPSGLAMLGIIGPVVDGKQNNWLQYLFWMPCFPFEVILTQIF